MNKERRETFDSLFEKAPEHIRKGALAVAHDLEMAELIRQLLLVGGEGGQIEIAKMLQAERHRRLDRLEREE